MSSDSEGFESADEDIDSVEVSSVSSKSSKSLQEQKTLNVKVEDHPKKTDVTIDQGQDTHVRSQLKGSKGEPDANIESSSMKLPHNSKSKLENEIRSNETHELDKKSCEEKEPSDIENCKPSSTVVNENLTVEDNGRDCGDDNKLEGWDFDDEDGFEIPQKLGSNIKTIEVKRPIFEDGDGPAADVDITFPKSPKEEEAPKQSVWGSWSGWGVTSLLSTATDSVQTLTQQVSSVSSGITSAIGGGIEGFLEAPDPEELARMTLKEESAHEDPPQSAVPDLFGLSNLIGGVSQLGSKVISGGLDTLENLGKKTMEVLQEGDPGFKKKRAFLFQSEKPILSQVLREAKERSENEEKDKEDDTSLRKVQYETLFDDFHGLVHLEALEMISRQCEIKVQNLLTEAAEDEALLVDYKDTLENVRDLCELPESDDDECISLEEFKSKIESAMESLPVSVSFDKLFSVNFDEESCLNKLNTDLHKDAITDVAKFTALSMEFLHRIAESLLICDLSSPSTGSEALISITTAAKFRVNSLAEDYCTFLTKMDPSVNSPLVTNVYLEASNSCNYLENAFTLCIPVLQLGALS